MNYELVYTGPDYSVYRVVGFEQYFYRGHKSPIYHGPFTSAYHAAEAFKLKGGRESVVPLALLTTGDVIQVDFVARRRI